MKIKMISCAVTNELLSYNYGAVLTVGKEINEKLAKSFVDRNLAIVIEHDEKEEKVETAEKEEVKTVEKKKRTRKKGDVNEV